MKVWLIRKSEPAVNWHEVAWVVQAASREDAIDIILRDCADTFPFMYLPPLTELRVFLQDMEWREIASDQPGVILEHAESY